MNKFILHEGLVAPLDRANVDTDAIIPKQFLKSIKRSGFGPNLFDEWRYLDHGEPGMDNSKRPLNPDFVLNQERYQGASILLSRKNFGCGSSREHAPWALADFGFRAVVSTEIADIFTSNALKNGVLPVVIDQASWNLLAARPGENATIDLDACELRFGNHVAKFKVESFARRCLLDGVDTMGWLVGRMPAIEAYEKQRAA